MRSRDPGVRDPPLYNRLDTASQANQVLDYDYAANGTLDKLTDGNNAVTDYSYDALQRLVSSTEDLSHLNVQTAYTYDVADRLTKVTDPNGLETIYQYDDLGNLLSQSSPDTGLTSYSYDAAGNLISKTDARGIEVAYEYDAANRLVFIDAPGTAEDIVYEYDTCDQGVGRLCAVTYGASGDANDISYGYNGFGDVIAHQGVQYRYDAAGRVASMIYASGTEVLYQYDSAGNVSNVSVSTASGVQSLASDLAYAPFGGVSHLNYGNGLSLSQQWDTAYRMSSQSGSLSNVTYPAYDGNGNLTNRVMDGENQLYTYDGVNRLETASGQFGSRDYDYDANSNRTSVERDTAVVSYAYQPGSNILATETGWHYSHDANGNRLAKQDAEGIAPTTDYSYNAYNRLSFVSRTDVGVLAQYSYNALGQRVSKTTAAGSRDYIYDLAGQLVLERDASGEMQEYVYLNGQPLAVRQISLTPPSPQEVILDETSVGVSPVGSWRTRKGRRSYENDFLLASGGSGSSVRYEPTLDGGVYDVYGWWPQIRKNSSAVPVTVAHVEGTNALTVDQTSSGHDWSHLGKYRFAVGEQGSITFSDANGAAASDAVRFVKVVEESEPRLVYLPWHYIHVDHLGTPHYLSDESGVKVWQATYGPFGQTGIDEDVDGDGRAVSFNLAFPGQYHDSESGLHYNYFRYYDPQTGRYLTSDPIGLAGGPNTYAYVGGNPLRFIDLLGLVITGEWAGFSVSNVSGNYTGLTAHLERGPNGNDLVDRLGYFNFEISGTLGAKVKCKETECGEVKREWYLDGSVSVSDIDFRVPYDEPAIPIPGMGAVIMADKVLRTGQYINQWKSLIQTAGKALLNSPTLICQGSAFAK